MNDSRTAGPFLLMPYVSLWPICVRRGFVLFDIELLSLNNGTALRNPDAFAVARDVTTALSVANVRPSTARPNSSLAWLRIARRSACARGTSDSSLPLPGLRVRNHEA